MASLLELLQTLLQSERMMDFLSAKEDLEKALYAASVIDLAMFQEILNEEADQFSNCPEDLDALTQFLAVLEEGEEEQEFPLFSQTRMLVAEREQENAGLQDFMQARLESSRVSMSKLVKILDKILWVEKFVKMRNFHRWFLKAITDYVEINEYQEIEGEEQPAENNEVHLTQLNQARSQCMKAGLNVLARLQKRPVRESFLLWQRLPKPQRIEHPTDPLPDLRGKLRGLSLAFGKTLQRRFDTWKYCVQPSAQPLRTSARIFKQKLAAHFAQLRQQTQRISFIQLFRAKQAELLESTGEPTTIRESSPQSLEIDLVEVEDSGPRPWWLRMMRCMVFQKTRPTFKEDDLYYVL